jgi:hypothetical protein
MSAQLLVIGERTALAWVLGEQRMAFSANRRTEAARLRAEDELLLDTTGGTYHNRTRDRGRLIGEATVLATVAELDEPGRFLDRESPIGCPFRVERLAPLREGVELAPLVPDLESFPDPASWSARMRRPLVPLTEADTLRLRRDVDAIAGPSEQVLGPYLALA